MNRTLHRFAPLLLLIATVLLWQAVCSLFGVSEFIFPSPARVAEQAWEHRVAILGHLASSIPASFMDLPGQGPATGLHVASGL